MVGVSDYTIVYMVCVSSNLWYSSVLQIRTGGKRDNLGIISHITPLKHML